MARMVADDDIRVDALPAEPADIDAVTLAEANSVTATFLSDQLMFPLTLDATDSDTLNERALDESSASKVFTKRNADGEFVFLREFDGGQIDQAEDKFQDFKERGTIGYILVRRGGKAAGEAWEVGDEYDYFEVETDSPVNQSGEGYHKDRVKLSAKKFRKNLFIVDGS